MGMSFGRPGAVRDGMRHSIARSSVASQSAKVAKTASNGTLPAMQERPPNDPPRRTPIAYAQMIAQAYARRGMDPAAALAVAQITPAQLRSSRSRLTARQMEALSAHAMQELDDEALGWFRRRLPWGSYGMLARASLSAPTLGVAMARWCRHHGLLTDDIALSLRTEGTRATFTLEERHALGPWREFCQVSVLRNLLGLASWFIDSRIALQAAEFAFDAPPHAALLREALFPAPSLEFDAPVTRLVIDAGYLAEPLRRDEAALRQMLRRGVSIIVLSHRRDRRLVQQVRQMIAARPDQPHTADSVAAALHLSPRTLHRQLRDEDASLQQLKDDVRRERAQDLLLRTRRPIKQIAGDVGFVNDKSFTRAFQAWTGQGPATFRAARAASRVDASSPSPSRSP
jgi:AraC-like DNA-binding protein